MFMLSHLRKNKEKEKRFFMKNGGAVLEQLIRYFNGDCNPIRSYSAKELNKATSDFRWEILRGWNYTLYKGIHEDREISVKVFIQKSLAGFQCGDLEKIANEVAITSRMSSHKNVLKLLGCCFETELPILVYELPTKGNLGSYIYGDNNQQIPWERKLKIATGLANAVAYLHHGLPKMIIHRDIKPENIFLDQDDAAKFFDFQGAIPIPEGKTHVDAEVYGTSGLVAPEAVSKRRYTEKTDVYSFGVLLFEVLTGKRYSDLIPWNLVVDSRSSTNSVNRLENFRSGILAEYCETYPQGEIRAQVWECARLVHRSIQRNPDERPSMIQVEKTLRQIKTIRD